MKRSTAGGFGEACAELGIRFVFGLPGTQNVALFESIRASRTRTVLATSELAASFMAIGYARASGDPGVLATIPGPGFTYALPGLAEARLDSVPLIQVVVQEKPPPGRKFRHQEIDHLGIVGPLAKAVLKVQEGDGFTGAMTRARELATAGEPGPVVVWVTPGHGDFPEGQEPEPRAPANEPLAPSRMAEIVDRLSRARRPVFFLGLGAVNSAGPVMQLVERLKAPFFTTPSARGTIPEDHPQCLGFDFDRGGLKTLNELLVESDLILALGCKLGHNGTGGFRLGLPEDRLVHVNSDPEALGANYPASLPILAKVEEVVAAALAGCPEGGHSSEWGQEESAERRARISAEEFRGPAEPAVRGVGSGTVREVLEIFRDELPRDGIVVTDSGLHQLLVRRYFPVLAPGGLIMPTDFQSMGFGLPAAIGAKLAHPDRKVVAVIGDGGLAMSGMEFSSLVREKLPVTVLVFADGFLNLIRLLQEREFGKPHAVRLESPDMQAFADAFGVEYSRLDADVRNRLRAALSSPGPSLVELPLGDSREIRSVRRSARMKSLTRNVLGDTLADRLKRLFGKG